jgi:Zn finger protein HypA/HybF involved in hydrogenase expression
MVKRVVALSLRMSYIEHIKMAIPPRRAYVEFLAAAGSATDKEPLSEEVAMITRFECLGCGHVSILEKLPAKCPNCGHGNGVLYEESELAAKPPQRDPEENPRA